MNVLSEHARGERAFDKGQKAIMCEDDGTCPMDELGDHTRYRDAPETTVHYYLSLPIMLKSQSKDTATVCHCQQITRMTDTSTAA